MRSDSEPHQWAGAPPRRCEWRHQPWRTQERWNWAGPPRPSTAGSRWPVALLTSGRRRRNDRGCAARIERRPRGRHDREAGRRSVVRRDRGTARRRRRCRVSNRAPNAQVDSIFDRAHVAPYTARSRATRRSTAPRPSACRAVHGLALERPVGRQHLRPSACRAVHGSALERPAGRAASSTERMSRRTRARPRTTHRSTGKAADSPSSGIASAARSHTPGRSGTRAGDRRPALVPRSGRRHRTGVDAGQRFPPESGIGHTRASGASETQRMRSDRDRGWACRVE